MEKLTAMEQLIHWIESDCTPMDCVMKAKELLKVEKQQIIESYRDGRSDQQSERQSRFYNRMAEQYYQQTFKSE